MSCRLGRCEVGPPACVPGEICDDGTCLCDDTAVSFSDDVVPILQARCGGCHLSSNPSGGSAGLNLGPAFAYAELFEVDSTRCTGDNARKRVEPFAPAESYLMDKVLGVRLCSGGKMGNLNQSQLSALGRWICQGALDN